MIKSLKMEEKLNYLNDGGKFAMKAIAVYAFVLFSMSATTGGIDFTTTMENILGWMQAIGGVVVVIAVAVLAFQFMQSGELKEGFQKFVGIAVGGVVLGGAGIIGDLFFTNSGALLF